MMNNLNSEIIINVKRVLVPTADIRVFLAEFG